MCPLALAASVIVHGLILNITPRLFAINIRATLFGCCYSSGYLGSIICYLLVVFRAVDDVTMMIVEAGLAFLLIVLCCILPNVDGRELPDVMEDMDYFSEYVASFIYEIICKMYGKQITICRQVTPDWFYQTIISLLICHWSQRLFFRLRSMLLLNWLEGDPVGP